MLAKKLLIFITVLALTAISCGLSFNLPVTTDIVIGQTVTEEIEVADPNPDSQSMEVSISFGAGELTINPGAGALIEGTATFNVEDFRPEIGTTETGVELSTGNLEIEGFPKFNDRVINQWELNLSDRPMGLKVFGGAYKSDLELGGLNLTALRIADGAADVQVNFNEPNQGVMESFQYQTGASSVVLTNLGNANFRSMTFKGGAGSFDLDFSGQLQQDAIVDIQTGLSEMTIRVPDELDVRVQIDSGIANINTSGGWDQSGSIYTHDGDGPSLEVIIELNAGNLNLEIH